VFAHGPFCRHTDRYGDSTRWVRWSAILYPPHGASGVLGELPVLSALMGNWGIPA
jgi:hypothetical protein